MVLERGEERGCSMEVDSRRIALSCTHDAIRACLLRRREELEVVTRRERGRRKRRRRVEFIGIGIGIVGLNSWQAKTEKKREKERCMGQWERNLLGQKWCDKKVGVKVLCMGCGCRACVDLISFVGD